jgi:uncharacterized protein (TIGR00297 family)
MIERLVIGLAVAAIFSFAGYRTRALSGRGAVAALFVGTAVIWGLSWPGAAVLGTFFVTSSALSRIAAEHRVAAKGSRRDERQVLANGGIAALAALSALWIDPILAFAMFSGALAAATADTWATEIGSRSQSAPVLLLSRQAVPPGTSGGVTRLGTVGALAGSVAVGLLAATVAWLGLDDADPLPMAALIALAGMLGSLADSVLGEKLQERRWCPACDLPAEARVHVCGAPTEPLGGVAWVDNDMVNLSCTLVGALVGSLVALIT